MVTGDLFETPPAAPAPTGKLTQDAQVLRRLRQGPLTPLEAQQELGVMRLAAVVHRLKGRGHNITTENAAVQCRGNRTAHVARYHLAE